MGLSLSPASMEEGEEWSEVGQTHFTMVIFYFLFFNGDLSTLKNENGKTFDCTFRGESNRSKRGNKSNVSLLKTKQTTPSLIQAWPK